MIVNMSDLRTIPAKVLRVSGTDRSAVVNDLHPDVTYRIQLRVENTFGSSNYSQPLAASTLEEGCLFAVFFM